MTTVKQQFETISLHAGYVPDANTGARAVPLYRTSSYVFRDVNHGSDLIRLSVGIENINDLIDALDEVL